MPEAQPHPVPLSDQLYTYTVSAFWSAWVLPSMAWTRLTQGGARTPPRTKRPQILDDPTLGEHNFIKLNTGVKLHYVAKGPQSAPLMLFLHGFPEFWFSWRFQIREFSKDYRTVAVDMRGYGESDKPSGTGNYHLQYLIEDIKDLIQKLGYNKCVLVAHDWGGSVAMAFTLTYPNMVDKLVLCNFPHSKAFLDHLKKNRSQFLKSWYMFFFQMPSLPEAFLRNGDYKWPESIFRFKAKGSERVPCTKEEVEAYKYNMDQPGSVTAQVNYYRAALQYMPMKYKSLKVKTPTLMVWGTQDMALESVMAHNSQRFFSEMQLRLVPTSGHWVQMEEPTKVNMYIRQFLANSNQEGPALQSQL